VPPMQPKMMLKLFLHGCLTAVDARLLGPTLIAMGLTCDGPVAVR
jgi:hypothetical protein